MVNFIKAVERTYNTQNNQGFTLVEAMVVVAIVATLAAVAYPSYQRSVIATKRADMMSELLNIGSEIESQKLIVQKYSEVDTTDLVGTYPDNGSPLYRVAINDNNLESGKWMIEATPIPTSIVRNDGTLTLNYAGRKCRGAVCGTGNEWKEN